MATWAEVARSAPGLAAEARTRFDQGVHKVLATLRADGSPRVSGIETMFTDDDLWLGMMPGSVKATDLRRDPRLALHSPSPDPPGWDGDAKLSGRGVEVADVDEITAVLRAAGADQQADPASLHLFRVDLAELVCVRLGDPADHLVIERWTAAEGTVRHLRR